MSGGSRQLHQHRNSLTHIDAEYPRETIRKNSFVLASSNGQELYFNHNETGKNEVSVSVENLTRHASLTRRTPITNNRMSTSILTPPPVPLRTAPVVPKRKYVPNKDAPNQPQTKEEIQKQIQKIKEREQKLIVDNTQQRKINYQPQSTQQFPQQNYLLQQFPKQFQPNQLQQKHHHKLKQQHQHQLQQQQLQQQQLKQQQQNQSKPQPIKNDKPARNYQKDPEIIHNGQIYEPKLLNGETSDERNDNENWKYITQTIHRVPSTDSAQKTRQAVKSQLSIESSKQLKHSAVLSSENLDKTIHIKNPQVLQQYSNNISISKLTNNQTINANNQPVPKTLNSTKHTVMCNNTQNVYQQNDYTDIRTVQTFKKKLPPPPTEPPPSIPRQVPVSTATSNYTSTERIPVTVNSKTTPPANSLSINGPQEIDGLQTSSSSSQINSSSSQVTSSPSCNSPVNSSPINSSPIHNSPINTSPIKSSQLNGSTSKTSLINPQINRSASKNSPIDPPKIDSPNKNPQMKTSPVKNQKNTQINTSTSKTSLTSAKNPQTNDPPNRNVQNTPEPKSNQNTVKKKNNKNESNIPPPLSQIPTEPIENSPSSNKMSMRQDSGVSSDSFSQTSSPSYTSKTMETPLIPPNPTRLISNGRISTGRNNKLYNIVVSKNSGHGNESFDLDGTGKNIVTCSSPLTKSLSTPASLQTIVRFHNGSNMSLHHRIIRDMRRPSRNYISTIRYRFRMAQVAVNAIALLAIGGGLAAYFNAYPKAVQVVNHGNITSEKTLPTTSPGLNPAPGVCLPVIVSFCQHHKVPYNFTVFPNYMGHFGQIDAQQELEVYDAVVDVRCYELAALFLCSVFVPKCGPSGQLVRPCHSLCFETKRRCGFFLDVFGLTLPDYLDCSLFPESSDPNICVGHNEVKDAQTRAQRPVCPDGFQCDVKRCIPRDWQCDGHIDCKDQTDELGCEKCGKGKIHCGEDRCMGQEHMCDGKVDCPYAQDERNCIRLSERNGDEGRGKLEIYRPENQQWIPACITNWDRRHSANDICTLLGYETVNTSRLINLHYANITPPKREQVSEWRMNSNKKKTNLLKDFGSCSGKIYPTVDLICTNYVCGKVRKSYAEVATKRIIGGATSKPGDWPFLAALLGGPEEIFYCAGVLISDQWVLTASHCVGNHSDVSGWTIQLGITRRLAHSYYGQKVKVRRVIPHPMYNQGVPHDNDVALFQLESAVTFHEHLLPVCLPPTNKELLPGTFCTVIGWGKKEDKAMSEYEPAVNEVQVPVLNRSLCNSWLENRDLNVTEGMICAGYKEGGKDACQGDSGGPLLCSVDKDVHRWFVFGIVSWGIKCAHPHLPGVYAYVPKYIPWIKQQMELYSDKL